MECAKAEVEGAAGCSVAEVMLVRIAEAESSEDSRHCTRLILSESVGRVMTSVKILDWCCGFLKPAMSC